MTDDVAGDRRLLVTGGLAAFGHYAVIGHPVAQSLSPALHNAWLRALERPGRYEAIDLTPSELIRRAPAFPFEHAGLNVTAPHKVVMVGFADRVDEDARAAGATNLLYRDRDGVWTAGNTDGAGFLHALADAGAGPVAGHDVLILGAGGAARGIAAALRRAGVASLVFANRGEERSEALAAEFGGRALALHPEVLDMLDVSVDLVVNTLPAEADAAAGALDLSPLPPSAWVADVNYHVVRPRLLERASGRGLGVVDGEGMFLWQAALSFHRWTGEQPPIELGRRAVREALGRA